MSNSTGYGATAGHDDDFESLARAEAQQAARSSETKPLRQAFSMDVADDAHAAPPVTQYCNHMAALSVYVLGCTLVFGFCLGFTASFWVSGKFWASPLGLEKLGCTDAPRIGGVGGTAAHEAAGSVSSSGAEVAASEVKAEASRGDERPALVDPAAEVGAGTSILSVLPFEHITHGSSGWDSNNDWGSIYGPPLIDIAKTMKKHHHHHKRMTDPDNLDIVGTTRPNVYLNHPSAYEMLLESPSPASSSSILPSVPSDPASLSKYSYDYFLLSSGWDSQIDQMYCAVASVSTLLNSLRFLHPRNEVGVDVPVDAKYAPYAYADQTDVLGECADENVIPRSVGGDASGAGGTDGLETYPQGLGLSQTSSLLRCHLSPSAGWTVITTPLDRATVSLTRMRDDLKEALADPNARALVNYRRREAGQVGGGHWSPLASYSPSADAFLILDVAKYKYPPVWIPTESLYESMGTYDNCGEWDYPAGQERLVSKGGADLRHPRTEDEAREAMSLLGCKNTLRGYVIARKR